MPTLVTDIGETKLEPGMCAGFRAGGRAHHVVNRANVDALILEIDDITAALTDDGAWEFRCKDGIRFPD